jgi:LPS-assembly protein
MRLAAIAAVFAALAGAIPAQAQDPSTYSSGGGSSSVFAPQPGGMFGPTPKIDKAQPLYLQGDELIYDTKGNRTIARGNVEIFYNNNVLTADEVIYDQSANTLTAAGNVELKEANGNIIRADRYTLTDDFRDGFVQSLSVVARDDSRITAERGERREGNTTEFSKATFTACKSEGNMPPLWCIGANKIIHDQAAATISYQDATFELFGQPVFYLPYFQHPDPSVKRKSGFLAPYYGTSEELGFMTEMPYYFALDPSFDFTFHPRYLSKQGVLWQGDWRQKLANGSYEVNLAGIDQDCADLPGGCAENGNLDGARGSLETHGNFSLSSWWSYGWNVVLESDDSFRRFYKLDSILLTDRVNDVYFTGLSDRSYLGVKAYHFGGLLFDDTPQAESYVHPIVDHNYVFTDPVLGGELSWDSNLLSFSRNDVDTGFNDREDIARAVTEIKWRRRFTDTLGITYTPFGELRGDIYQFHNYIDPQTGELIEDETVARGLATGGATVAYPWVANGAGGSHVIEPIGQVIVRNASVRQNDLPDEDAKSLVFDDTNLFDTTKFSGYDRLETGTRANVGVQYTFQAWSGGHIRVLAGQSYHLAGENAYAEAGDPELTFSPNSGLENDRSDYVLGLHVAPTDVFRLISQSRFDEDDLSLAREDLTAQFAYGPLAAQLTYTYATFDPDTGFDEGEQDVIASLGLRLTDRWSLNGSIRYDIDEDQRLTDSIALTYIDECFMLSATYAETFIEDPTRDIEPDRVVMLRFELKHLGGFNYQTNVVDFAGGEDNSATANALTP